MNPSIRVSRYVISFVKKIPFQFQSCMQDDRWITVTLNSAAGNPIAVNFLFSCAVDNGEPTIVSRSCARDDPRTS